MPTQCSTSSHPKGRPWVARVTVKGKSYHLGYFATSDEAEWYEQEFRITMTGRPSNVASWDDESVRLQAKINSRAVDPG